LIVTNEELSNATEGAAAVIVNENLSTKLKVAKQEMCTLKNQQHVLDTENKHLSDYIRTQLGAVFLTKLYARKATEDIGQRQHQIGRASCRERV
jgi:hypothetical protein